MTFITEETPSPPTINDVFIKRIYESLGIPISLNDSYTFD